MNSFSSDYLRQMSNNNSNTQVDFSNNVPYTNSHTWNSHYSISDISLISRDEGDSTICGSDGQPLCRELNFCDLPEDIRCMYEVAKCGMPIANSFQDEQDYVMMMMMQNSDNMDQTPVYYGGKNCVQQQQRFESYDTPTWEEFKSSVDDASSGRWEEDDGEKLYQELMNESFKFVAVVKAPQQQPPAETDQEPDVPENVTVPEQSENTVLSSLEQDTVRSVVRDCTAFADPVKQTQSWSKKISEFLQLAFVIILSLLIFVVLPMTPMFFFEPGSLYRRYEFVGDFHR